MINSTKFAFRFIAQNFLLISGLSAALGFLYYLIDSLLSFLTAYPLMSFSFHLNRYLLDFLLDKVHSQNSILHFNADYLFDQLLYYLLFLLVFTFFMTLILKLVQVLFIKSNIQYRSAKQVEEDNNPDLIPVSNLKVNLPFQVIYRTLVQYLTAKSFRSHYGRVLALSFFFWLSTLGISALFFYFTELALLAQETVSLYLCALGYFICLLLNTMIFVRSFYYSTMLKEWSLHRVLSFGLDLRWKRAKETLEFVIVFFLLTVVFELVTSLFALDSALGYKELSFSIIWLLIYTLSIFLYFILATYSVALGTKISITEALEEQLSLEETQVDLDLLNQEVESFATEQSSFTKVSSIISDSKVKRTSPVKSNKNSINRDFDEGQGSKKKASSETSRKKEAKGKWHSLVGEKRKLDSFNIYSAEANAGRINLDEDLDFISPLQEAEQYFKKENELASNVEEEEENPLASILGGKKNKR